MNRTKALLLLLIFAGGLTLASCKSTSKCPAYGETKKYKVEKAY